MIERDLWKRQTANITEYDQATSNSFEGAVLQDISDHGQGEKSIATQKVTARDLESGRPPASGGLAEENPKLLF